MANRDLEPSDEPEGDDSAANENSQSPEGHSPESEGHSPESPAMSDGEDAVTQDEEPGFDEERESDEIEASADETETGFELFGEPEVVASSQDEPSELNSPDADRVDADSPVDEEPVDGNPGDGNPVADHLDAGDLHPEDELSEDTENKDTGEPDIAAVIEPLVRQPRTDPPHGIRRADHAGLDLVDAMAGRASALGFGHEFLETAWQSLDSSYCGDGSAYQPEPGRSSALLEMFADVMGDQGGCDVVAVHAAASPAEAMEWVIASVRTPERYRTITLAGSDHGCTGVGRTAGGLVTLQNGYGPLVAGFTHVRPDDPDSLAAAVDDQTTAVLVSPMATHDGGRPISADMLIAARQICDSHDLSLIIDQTQVTFGSGGAGLAHRTIADVNADAVLCSAGLFGGLSGAIVAVGDRLSEPSAPRLPLQESVAIAALIAIADQGVMDSGKDRSGQLAVELAERVSQYDFVRDLHLLGPCIGMETDVASESLVVQAAEDGLRIEAAGETSVRMQLPLLVSDSDWSELLTRLDHTLAAVRDRMAVPV